MRILCLDVGTKRIGVAVTDPLGWTAQPLRTLQRGEASKLFSQLLDFCSEYEVEKIVIGLPYDAEGGEGRAAKRVRRFAEQWSSFLQRGARAIPIAFWDERYSTREAEERLLEADVSRKKRRQVIDKMAAAVILESYLRAHEAAMEVT